MRESFKTNQNMNGCKRKINRLWRSLFVGLLLAGFSMSAIAQITISGVVNEANGETMPGVSVSVKGTAIGGVTDINGKYSINVPNAQAVLVFSFVGYVTQEFTVGDQREIHVTLKEDTKQLQEVVVIGYGTTISKRDATGAISTVNEKTIEERTPLNVFDALQGSAPGVQIQAESGAPGASVNILVRGASTFSEGGVKPLYIVDGVIVPDIDNINPADIKSMDILKDGASGAIYGARSANGVIIITTRQGEAGKPRVDARIVNSYSWIANTLPQVNMLEQYFNIAGNRVRYPEKFSDPSDSVSFQNSTNIYYPKALTRIASRLDANLTVSGGSDKTTYMASIGYIGDQGTIVTSYNNKLTARINMDFTANRLKFMSRFNFAYSKTNAIDEFGVIFHGMRRPPNASMRYADGSFIPQYLNSNYRNPLQELYQQLREDARFQATLYQGGEYKFTNHLRLQATVTGTFELRRRDQFRSGELENAANSPNSGYDQMTWTTKYEGQVFMNYNRTFGDHGVTAMIGSSAETGLTEDFRFQGTNFLSESGPYTFNLIGTMNMATTSTYTSASDYGMASAFGNVSYNYKGRYQIQGTLRYDGSSRFGSENRWGSFPSVSGYWRFSDEPFMDWASTVLTDGKIRGGWAVTGNDRIGNYDSQILYQGSGIFNGVKSVMPGTRYGNPKIKWEETRQSGIGIDLTFLGGRANATVDWYKKKTTDLLSITNLPFTTGYVDMRMNLASLENRGFELTLAGTPVSNKDFTWQTSVMWWTNKNKVLDLAREDYVQSTKWLIAKGKPLGQWYAKRYLGVYAYDVSNAYTSDYSTRLNPVLKRDDDGNVLLDINQQPTVLQYLLPDGTEYPANQVKQRKVGTTVSKGGDVIWEALPRGYDEAGNPIYSDAITDADRQILGKATPDWYASWINTIRYRQFTLSFNFYVSWGGLIYNQLKYDRTRWGGNTHMQDLDYILEGWKYQGQAAGKPYDWYRVHNDASAINYGTPSDRYLEDGSFIRLRNVRLSYRLDSNIAGKLHIKGIEAYIYGTNLLTWTNYLGFDPEVGSSNPLTPGEDNSSYPKKREVGFGFNVNF